MNESIEGKEKTVIWGAVSANRPHGRRQDEGTVSMLEKVLTFQ